MLSKTIEKIKSHFAKRTTTAKSVAANKHQKNCCRCNRTQSKSNLLFSVFFSKKKKMNSEGKWETLA